MKKRNAKVPFLKSNYFKVAVVIFIVISSLSAYSLSINAKVKEWEDKIYPGISVNGVDLSGKTKEEALQILQEELSTKIAEKEINMKIGENKKTYHYSDISASYDFENTVEEALNYGKEFGVMAKNDYINEKKQKNIELKVSYDEEKIQKIVQDVKTETKVEPMDASIKINAGAITIIPEIVGKEIVDENIDTKIKEAINGEVGGSTEISIDLKEKKAKVTKEDLSKINSKPMSSFETSFTSSNAERSANIDLAASLVNGTILMPGEEFSYSEVSQRGRGKYKNAGVYINNKVEMAEAGGICQVSTTLYRAVMRSNIRSTERINHSLPVGYSEKGLDATVSWGSLDYKFKNTYDFPIYIEATTYNKIVHINVYGDTKALDGKTYEMKSEVIENIEPSIKYVDEPTMPVGTEEVQENGQAGCKVKSYQITYKDGVEINREVVSTDTYAAQPKTIKRGTAVVVEPKVPEVPNTPTTGTVVNTQPNTPTDGNSVHN